MDVSTQDAISMTMKGVPRSAMLTPLMFVFAEWIAYYNDPDKTDLRNVISLEFSHSRLDRLVVPPTLVSINMCIKSLISVLDFGDIV